MVRLSRTSETYRSVPFFVWLAVTIMKKGDLMTPNLNCSLVHAARGLQNEQKITAAARRIVRHSDGHHCCNSGLQSTRSSCFERPTVACPSGTCPCHVPRGVCQHKWNQPCTANSLPDFQFDHPDRKRSCSRLSIQRRTAVALYYQLRSLPLSRPSHCPSACAYS